MDRLTTPPVPGQSLIDYVQSGIGSGVNAFIANALRMLGDLLDTVPIVGDTLEAIVDNIAAGMNQTNTTATTASTTANTAKSTAETAAADAATANSQVAAAFTAASNAQTAASSAANVAAQAKTTADIAYANAQYWKDEFSVSSSGLTLGKNEEVLGMLMDVAPGKIRKITAVRYAMVANSGTLTLELRKIAPNNAETVIHTTNVPSAATKYQDNAPDYTVTDGDYIVCSVLSMSGNVTVLHCALIGVLIDA